MACQEQKSAAANEHMLRIWYSPLPSSSVKGLQLADEGGIKERGEMAPVKAKPGSMEKAS
jgi:hypothetical protein